MYKFSDIVILCVGTNKVQGDCIGPIVGQKLSRLLKQKENIAIYGTMKNTLNLKNAKQVINEVFEKYKKPFIITVDAALGPKKYINNIVVNKGNVQIGSSLKNSISYQSHLNIKGVVGEYKNSFSENIKTLKLVDRNIVNKLSNKITYEVYKMVEIINDV